MRAPAPFALWVKALDSPSVVFQAAAPYLLPMTMSEIRSSINGADNISSGVFASTKSGLETRPIAECAEAIHLLCDAVRNLTSEVERLQRQVK